MDELLIERAGPVVMLKMNRPHVLNASNAALHERLAKVWAELADEDDCRVVVLTGVGAAFSAGGDLELLESMTKDVAFRHKMMDRAVQIVREMVRFPSPVIAAVNGPAVGLGSSLASLCDIVLVEESAYFADPHVSVGLVAADGGALTWPTLTSLLRAKEYIYTGDRIPSAVAVEIGLANRVVPDGTSVEHALALAERLAVQPQRALQATKRSLNKQLERSLLDVLDYAVSAEWVSSGSEEHAAIVHRMRSRSESR